MDTVNRRSTTNQTKSRTVIKRGLIYIPSATQSALPVNSRITVVPCFNSGMAYDDNMMTTTPTSHCTYHTPLPIIPIFLQIPQCWLSTEPPCPQQQGQLPCPEQVNYATRSNDLTTTTMEKNLIRQQPLVIRPSNNL